MGRVMESMRQSEVVSALSSGSVINASQSEAQLMTGTQGVPLLGEGVRAVYRTAVNKTSGTGRFVCCCGNKLAMLSISGPLG